MTRWERALAVAYGIAEIWHACLKTGFQLTREVWRWSRKT